MLQQHRKGVTFLPKFESGMENMADMFVFETGDLLEKLDEILMRTEQEDSISSDDINEIFRTMHTIKGSAAMMSMHNMSTLAHSVEDLFYIIREDPTVKYDKPLSMSFFSQPPITLNQSLIHSMTTLRSPIFQSLKIRYTPLLPP